jgi:hypothetical protein
MSPEERARPCPFCGVYVDKRRFDSAHSDASCAVECVQCGARRKRGEFGKWWPTGAWSCRLCYESDFA